MSATTAPVTPIAQALASGLSQQLRQLRTTSEDSTLTLTADQIEGLEKILEEAANGTAMPALASAGVSQLIHGLSGRLPSPVPPSLAGTSAQRLADHRTEDPARDVPVPGDVSRIRGDLLLALTADGYDLSGTDHAHENEIYVGTNHHEFRLIIGEL